MTRYRNNARGDNKSRCKRGGLLLALLVSASISVSAAASEYTKPMPGERAASFAALTLGGDKVGLESLVKDRPLSLVFLDALCPMPHFPGCEAKLARLNELVAADKSRNWLAVVNAYYVGESDVIAFRSKFKLELPLVFDRNNEIVAAYGVLATPYRIDIDREGVIRQRGDSL